MQAALLIVAEGSKSDDGIIWDFPYQNDIMNADIVKQGKKTVIKR